MDFIKIIFSVVLLVVFVGCDNHDSHIFVGSEVEPISTPYTEPHPVDPLRSNPTSPTVSTGSTLTLMAPGFQSVDSGNQNYQSNNYRGHGNTRFIGGVRQSGNLYQAVSPDLNLVVK